MKRMRTFLKYVLWIVLFFIFSDFLINVGLNSSYKSMENTGNVPQGVKIEYAESTLVNGKIKGTIENTGDEDLTGKYIQMDFYSSKNNLLGTKYIPIEATSTGAQEFETFFELQDVKSYDMSIVDQKNLPELELIPEEMKKPEIILLSIMTMLMFW